MSAVDQVPRITSQPTLAGALPVLALGVGWHGQPVLRDDGLWWYLHDDQWRLLNAEYYTQNAHGFATLTPVYLDGTWQASNATLNTFLAEAVVVHVPDANTLGVQRTGIAPAPAHGRAIGPVHYLQDDGTLGIAPGTIDSPLANFVTPDLVRLRADRPLAAPVAAPVVVNEFDTVAALPLAGTRQAGETVSVTNDGANTGRYLAVGPTGAAAIAWLRV